MEITRKFRVLPGDFVRSACQPGESLVIVIGWIVQQVVIIEDLISTGRSSLKAVSALRNAGCEVLGMTAIFTYGFPKSAESFRQAGCLMYTLSDYDSMIQLAIETGYISDQYKETLKTWRQSPETWQTDK